MILSHIVAVSENSVIGKDNSLLWHIPEDLIHFKKRTTGKIMIMGRKTFDSLKKPLSKRFHIVISKSNRDSSFENVKYVGSLSQAYTLAEKMTLGPLWPEEVMIIGGGEIYKNTMKDTDFIYLTHIPGQYSGDTYYSLQLPPEFKIAFSQFSESVPGLRFEIWSKEKKEY